MVVHDGTPVAVSDQLFFDFRETGSGEAGFFVLQESFAILWMDHRHGELVEPISMPGLFGIEDFRVFDRSVGIYLFGHLGPRVI